MPKARPSEAVEDFIKAVYTLQSEATAEAGHTFRVSTNALRDALQIKAPSVTDMAQRLVDDDLVDYVKYQGVRLTEQGQALALNLIRRHRLIELYLVRELGYALHEVHDEAEKLEHVVSERFITAIDHKLDYPSFDPHGDPIPDRDGSFTDRDLYPLTDFALATPCRIARFIATDPAMLQHALDRGFQLHTQVQISARDPFQGPLTVQFDDQPSQQQVIIGYTLAKTILVEPLGS